MSKATYHESKIYLPKKIREALKIVNGDVLRIEVVEKDAIKISIVNRKGAEKGHPEKT